MPTRRIRAAARRTVLSIVMAVGATAVLLPAPPAAAAELLPNRSFELSVAEGSILEPSPIHGTLLQPVLPSGWTFEGAAGLFDHAHPNTTTNPLEDRTPAHGLRFAQISVPLSGNKDTTCQGDTTCYGTLDTAKNEGRRAYSVDPAWRPIAPISVSAGRSYTLSTMAELDFLTRGEFAFVQIRWLNASADPISLSARAKSVFTDHVNERKTWHSLAVTATAPAGAAFAVPLLGVSDAWIGAARFDLASFSG